MWRKSQQLQSMRQRAGFSLVELLVVIGIIAALAAMLMPALSTAKARSQSLQCQTKLREIGVAAQLHQLSHGFYPLAGWHWDPAGGVVNPVGLGDAAARRYVYYHDDGERRPAPVTAALAVSLGVPVRLDSRAVLEADMQADTFRKHFTCPSQHPQLTGISQTSSEGWSAPKDWSSYVFNEALLGRRGDRHSTEAPVGKMNKVKDPTFVMLAMDGRPRAQHMDNFLLIPDRGAADTVLDFHRFVLSPANTMYGPDLLDFLRHRWRANVVFADGHVESVHMGDGGLASIGVSKGISSR